MHPSAECIILIIKSILKKVTTSLSETWKISDNLIWIDEDVVASEEGWKETILAVQILCTLCLGEEFCRVFSRLIIIAGNIRPLFYLQLPFTAFTRDIGAINQPSNISSSIYKIPTWLRQPSDKIDKIGFPIPVHNDWQFICVLCVNE